MNKTNNIYCIEEWISILPKSVKNAIDYLLYRENIEQYKLKVMPRSFNGDNSYGLILALVITPVNQMDNKEFKFIVKLSPKNEARRKQTKVVEYYKREVFMYKRVLNEYKNIQNEFNVPLSNQFNSVPIMYYSSLNNNDEFLIFQDLHGIGYSMFSKRKSLTFNHTRLALMELAKFHSMSFILQEKKPKLFKKLLTEIKYDNLFNDQLDPISIELGKKYINLTIELLNDENILNKKKISTILYKIRDNFKELCIKLVNGKKYQPYSVICHGDFWNNNILYQYNDNEIPVSAKLLDFQMARYAPPVLDILHYIFACTEKKLRDKHFHNLKNTYYESLSNHLKLFNLNPNIIYSYSKFEKQLKYFGIFGFCMSIYAIPFFISESNDIPNLDEVSEAVHQISNLSTNQKLNGNKNYEIEKICNLLDEFELLNEKTMPIFKRRIIDVVNDLHQYEMLFIPN